MKTNKRNCKCVCVDYNNQLWDICNCECECKAHRTIHLDKEFWEKEEKKKLFFRSLKNKKEKQELEEDIDNIVFGDK